ncbi:hypothetical protein DL764_009852 [Monosporascus ibericus]|uniref:WW domain-containing protein n=1 Tax=Monosporascus ibericus TaxID=155417 RepID=A0A4Q4SWY8_9PEZI|nr:hypothetical protein DL764_009852 [Monosporascus ibericus]
MADFEAPAGPPPPKVPEGWVARWNDQYKEWFYVNIYTKKSQWDKPTEPAVDPSASSSSGAPDGPPPGYTPGSAPAPTDSKNPFVNEATKPGFDGGGPSDEDADARLARQLQEEENARSRSAGTPSSHHQQQPYGGGGPGTPGSHSPYPDQLPPRPAMSEKGKSKGFLGKLKDKLAASGSGHHAGGFPSGGSHGGYGGYSQQQHYGAPPPQQGYYGAPQYGGGGYGAPVPGHYGHGPMGGGYGGGYGGGGGFGGRRPGGGGGMGMGGVALGAGAGLLGGALIANAVNDNEQDAYMEGYEDGQDNDMGGGGDDFGGDF